MEPNGVSNLFLSLFYLVLSLCLSSSAQLVVNVRNSDLFGRIVRLSAELDMKREEARAREAEAWKAKQAAVAEATSKWRARRKRRVKELRAAVMKVAYTGNPNPQELQVSEACTAIC